MDSGSIGFTLWAGIIAMSVMQTCERASFSDDDISLLHSCRGMSQSRAYLLHRWTVSDSFPLHTRYRRVFLGLCYHHIVVITLSPCVSDNSVGRRASKELPRLFRSHGRYGAAIICCSPAFKRWVLQLAVIPNVYIKAPTKLHHVFLLLPR